MKQTESCMKSGWLIAELVEGQSNYLGEKHFKWFTICQRSFQEQIQTQYGGGFRCINLVCCCYFSSLWVLMLLHILSWQLWHKTCGRAKSAWSAVQVATHDCFSCSISSCRMKTKSEMVEGCHREWIRPKRNWDQTASYEAEPQI